MRLPFRHPWAPAIVPSSAGKLKGILVHHFIPARSLPSLRRNVRSAASILTLSPGIGDELCPLNASSADTCRRALLSMVALRFSCSFYCCLVAALVSHLPRSSRLPASTTHHSGVIHFVRISLSIAGLHTQPLFQLVHTLFLLLFNPRLSWRAYRGSAPLLDVSHQLAAYLLSAIGFRSASCLAFSWLAAKLVLLLFQTSL